MTRKITAVTVLFLSLFVLLTACVSEQEESFDFNIETTTTLDLSGYECVIAQHTEADNSGTLIADGNPFGYVATSVFADDILQRIADIEAETNCKVTVETISTSSSLITMSAIAQTYISEALFSASHNLTKAAADSGALLPIQSLDAIDLNNHDKWGDANVYEINSKNGEVYGVCPMYWLFKQPRSVSTIVVNSELAQRFSCPNLKEYLENGTWNWETFAQTLDDYTIDDGENHYYALAYRFFDFVKLAVFGNGCSLARTAENGSVVSDMESDKAIEAIEWVRNLLIEKPEAFEYGTTANDWPDTTKSFVEGRSLMVLTSPSVVYTSFVYEADEFYTMPFPTGPSGVQGEWPSVLEAAECFSIMSTANEPYAAATIIDMLCEPLASFPDEASMIAYLAQNVLFSEEDAELMMTLHKNGRYSYWYSTVIDDFWRAFQGGNILTKTPVEIITTNINKINETIDKLVIPNLPLYEEYAG